MSLSEYSKIIFADKNIIYSIILNLAYSITFNKPCKNMFFFGDLNNIQNFLQLLMCILQEKIVFYKQFLQSTENKVRYCKFIIFEKEDNFKHKQMNNFSKIILSLDQLYYFDSELLIKFEDKKYDFEIKDLSNQLNCLLTKFINTLLLSKNFSLYNESKITLSYLYHGYLNKNFYFIADKRINLEDLHKLMCDWCKINLSFNYVKEYLIEIFGKPDYYNGWKKLKIE